MITRCGRVALILLLATAVARPAAAAFDADSARVRAHALMPLVLHGDAGPLWGEFDPAMRAALKDSSNWAATLQGILASLGPLDSLAREEVTTRPGGFVYDAHGRFAKAPGMIEMILAFDVTGRVGGLLFRPDKDAARTEYPSRFLDYRTRTALRLPFRGEWTVFWGGRTLGENYHAFTRDQRFAMDLLIMRGGRTHTGDGRALSDYFCYGQPVLAPAAGTVVWAVDSLPDNPPGTMDPAHATGNSLVIDHGNGEFSLLAHLQPGSLRYRVGDRVPADATVGRCGNSGNTSEPHVHYHLQNGPRPFDADGLPVQFVDLIVDGHAVPRAEIVKGQVVRRAR